MQFPKINFFIVYFFWYFSLTRKKYKESHKFQVLEIWKYTEKTEQLFS